MVYPEKCITLILNMEIIPKKHTLNMIWLRYTENNEYL